MRKKLFIITISIVGLLVFYSLTRQITDSLQAGKRLDDEAASLTQLQKTNAELQKQLAEVNTPGFIEAQARNKLNLARPGETVVIIPQQDLAKVLSASKPAPEVKLPNWQGWLKLFHL